MVLIALPGETVLTFLLGRMRGDLLDPLVLYSDVFSTGHYWQLLSCAFLHGGIWHLF